MVSRVWGRLRGWVDSLKSLLRTSSPFRALLSLALAVIGASCLYSLWAATERPNPAKILEADNVLAWLTAISADDRSATPVTFIDVDERSYEQWGAPKSVPRKNLIDLLEIADKARPTAIVLDFDVTRDDAGETQAMTEYLAKRDPTVPLLLVRPFTRLAPGRDVAGAVLERKNRLEAAVIPASGAQWVAAYLDTDDGWFSRRWRGYEFVCSDGRPRAYPSVALATTALANNSSDGLQRLDAWLQTAAARRCKRSENAGHIVTTPSWLRNADDVLLIPYSVGFTTELLRFGSTMVGGRPLPIFSRFNAAHLVERKQDYLAEPPDLSARVAIIGASYEASGDWHRTPLGRMPGMYVIGNMVAFGGDTIAENRWWGLKPLLLGIGLFGLHLLAGLVLRSGAALLLIAAVTAVLLPVLVRAGVSATSAYEAAAIGIGLIALHAGARAAVETFVNQGSDGKGSWLGRLLLSERGREWLSNAMGKRGS